MYYYSNYTPSQINIYSQPLVLNFRNLVFLHESCYFWHECDEVEMFIEA
jgi:hypothetical protein